MPTKTKNGIILYSKISCEVNTWVALTVHLAKFSAVHRTIRPALLTFDLP